jgi:peptidoglycan hydrolase-like protein with peptidoglycan-binding domain
MKYSRLLIIGALVFALALPPTLSAQTVGDAQSQINQLLQQIRDLQEQVLRLRLTTVGSTTPAVPPLNWRHRICLVAGQLQEGDQNDDVRSLQEFLREQGLLSAEATGFFGPITREALRRWQANNLGLTAGDAATTGWGAFGPRTRSFIARWCGGNSESSVLRANPQRGTAPLAVVFTSTERVADTSLIADAPGLKIVFGDGQEKALECDRPVSTNATGTATSIEGRSGFCPMLPVAHTYTANGTYTATLVRYGGFCAGACPVTTLARTQIVVGPVTSGGDPIISSFTGPEALTVNQSGTWTVNATDPQGGPLSYHIAWGDQGFAWDSLLALGNITEFTSTSTFSHAYPRAGVFAITARVRDNAGNIATASKRVNVGNQPTENIIACTMDAYQCPNGQWVGRTGPHCQFVCSGFGSGEQPHDTPICTYGGQTYQEGGTYTTRTSCSNTTESIGQDFVTTCSATFVCRSGSWVQTNGQVQGNASCTYGGETYAHGATASCGLVFGDRCYPPESAGFISGGQKRSVCSNGSWHIQ